MLTADRLERSVTRAFHLEHNPELPLRPRRVSRRKTTSSKSAPTSPARGGGDAAGGAAGAGAAGGASGSANGDAAGSTGVGSGVGRAAASAATAAALVGAGGDDVVEGPPLIERLNSTGSVFVGHTMQQPDVDATIAAVGTFLMRYIEAFGASGETNSKEADFDFDCGRFGLRTTSTVSAEVISKFITRMVKRAQLTAETVIIALIYVERLLARTVIKLSGTNWYPIVFTALLLASKVWDDLSMIAQDFASISRVGLKNILQWETMFLKAISFNVSMRASIYARYFFEIEDLIVKQGHLARKARVEAKRREQALSISDAFRMEAVSSAVEARYALMNSPHRDTTMAGRLMFFSANTDAVAAGSSLASAGAAGGGSRRSKFFRTVSDSAADPRGFHHKTVTRSVLD